MNIVDWVIGGILGWISTYQYLGILLLMALESACMPIPSEIVMPFSGYLVWRDGEMSMLGIVLAGSLGCTVGSIAAYVAGFYAGRPLIVRYGKYFLITEKHLAMADKWFEKWGPKATFIARLLPIIRTVISLPAGIARMDFRKFVLYSFVGSVPWNLMLAYVGYSLGPNWRDIEDIFHQLDLVVIAGVVALVIWYVYRIRKNGSREKTPEQEKPQP